MGEKKRKVEAGEAPELKDFVCYALCVVSAKVRAVDEPTAAKIGAKQVRAAMVGVDGNIFIQKVGVMEANYDLEQRENIAHGKVPWLTEGTSIGDTGYDGEGNEDDERKPS